MHCGQGRGVVAAGVGYNRWFRCMLLVYSVLDGEWIHTQVTNKSYAISCAISFVARWGRRHNGTRGKQVSKQAKINCTTTQRKKRMRNCLPLIAARPHCLAPHIHNSKAWGSSSIKASIRSVGPKPGNSLTAKRKKIYYIPSNGSYNANNTHYNDSYQGHWRGKTQATTNRQAI